MAEHFFDARTRAETRPVFRGAFGFGPTVYSGRQLLTLAKSLREDGQVGPFWQKGFFDHILRSAESYDQKWDYVRQNPVRAGLVREAQDWPYQGEVFRLGYDL